MALWRLVLLTLFCLSLPLAAQAARTPAKTYHLAHHTVHAAKSHKTTHRTAQVLHLPSAHSPSAG